MNTDKPTDIEQAKNALNDLKEQNSIKIKEAVADLKRAKEKVEQAVQQQTQDSNDIEVLSLYQELVEACHESICENTKVIEQLSILIEETRKQNDPK